MSKESLTEKLRVLMIGAGRSVQGGISTVVNQYYEAGLEQLVDLRYIETMLDGSKTKKMYVAFKALIQFIRELDNVDVLHVHMSSRMSFYRKRIFINLAYKKNKKIVIHLHGSEFDLFYEKECNEKQKEMVRDVFSKVDVIVALSEEWANWLTNICDEGKIYILYNSIVLPSYRRDLYDDKNVLFLGRLGKRKGIYDLLEVIPTVLEEVPDAKFYIGGDGDVDHCKKIVKEKQLEDAVSFLGWITSSDGKNDYLKKCSTFVLPTYHEGMPMSILEAMSYGEIVVSTYVGGIPRIIDDGTNGFLFEAGDINALKNKLVTALTSSNRTEIGKKAFETISEKFNAVDNVKKLIGIYQSLCGESYYSI